MVISRKRHQLVHVAFPENRATCVGCQTSAVSPLQRARPARSDPPPPTFERAGQRLSSSFKISATKPHAKTAAQHQSSVSESIPQPQPFPAASAPVKSSRKFCADGNPSDNDAFRLARAISRAHHGFPSAATQYKTICPPSWRGKASKDKAIPNHCFLPFGSTWRFSFTRISPPADNACKNTSGTDMLDKCRTRFLRAVRRKLPACKANTFSATAVSGFVCRLEQQPPKLGWRRNHLHVAIGVNLLVRASKNPSRVNPPFQSSSRGRESPPRLHSGCRRLNIVPFTGRDGCNQYAHDKIPSRNFPGSA